MWRAPGMRCMARPVSMFADHESDRRAVQNLRNVKEPDGSTPLISSAHLEGRSSRCRARRARSGMPQGPVPEIVDRMLEAADGCLRQITIAPGCCTGSSHPQLRGRRHRARDGHCDADYETARRALAKAPA